MLAETVETLHYNHSFSNMLQPIKDNILQHFYNYETPNHYECQATTILDTLSVPYESCHPPASPQISPCGHGCSHEYKYDMFHSEYSETPIETPNEMLMGNISSLDHSHGFSFGDGGIETIGAYSFPHENFTLALPLEREIVAHPIKTSELFTLNVESSMEELTSIKRELKDSSGSPSADDITGITYNRESHSFTPDSLDGQDRCTRDSYDKRGRYSDTLHNDPHPKSNEEYPYKVGCATGYGSPQVDQYEPLPQQADFGLYNKEFRTCTPSELIVSMSSYNEAAISPPSPILFVDDYLFDDNEERDSNNIKASVSDVTEAKARDSEHLSNLYPIEAYKNDGETHLLSGAQHSKTLQLYSDEAGYYHDDAPSQSGTSSMYELEESSPRPQIKQDVHTFTSERDKNETISTHSPTPDPCIVHSKAPSDKLSINVSVNEKEIKKKDKASCKIPPPDRKTKPHLLPPEADRYWTGPDENNNFLCLYMNCGKKFTRRYNIRTHIQTHLGDRPFTCKLCLKSFVRQHDLNRHTRSHTNSQKCNKALENDLGAIHDTSNQWAMYEVVFSGWNSSSVITERHHSKQRPAAFASCLNGYSL